MKVLCEDGSLFRPMTEADLGAVAELEKICFRSPWTKGMLREELRNRAARYHVMELHEEIVAYAGMWTILDEAHITNVAVAPEYRRRGFGRRLMLLCMRAALELGAREMTLEVRVSNEAAQALYHMLDFEISGRRKKYYTDTGEDALILWNRDMRATVERLRSQAKKSIIQ